MNLTNGLQVLQLIVTVGGIAHVLIKLGRFLERQEQLERRVNRVEDAVFPVEDYRR